MKTTISIGYNSDSFSRKMRLMNAFQTAGDKSDSSFADLRNKVAGLSDSDGELAVLWAILPTRDEIDAFREAWTSVGEKGDCVTHVWLGMPDKPIAASTNANLIPLVELCKKLADTYYREYLQHNEQPTKQTGFSDEGNSKKSKSAHKPNLEEALENYFQNINEKA